MPKSHHFWALLFAFLNAVLLYGVFRSTPPQELFAQSDKAGHLLIFFAVTLTGRLAKIPLPKWAYWSIWAGLAFGLEYLQGAVRPLRIFSITDAWANLAGVLMALAIWLALARLLYRNREDCVGPRTD
jgi:hypothetical protein